MFKSKKIVMLSVTSILLLHSANTHAASITNADDKPYTITITEDGKSSTKTIDPSQRLDNFCAFPCLISLQGSDDQFEIEAKDELIIEDGEFYLDQEDGPSDTGDTPQLDN